MSYTSEVLKALPPITNPTIEIIVLRMISLFENLGYSVSEAIAYLKCIL
jgi:hypothetical protein